MRSLQGNSEVFHTGKAFLGFFGQGLQHDLINSGRDRGYKIVRRFWEMRQLPQGHLHGRRTIERAYATEPLVGDYSQRILIAGGTGFAADLLWCYVQHGSGGVRWMLILRILG